MNAQVVAITQADVIRALSDVEQCRGNVDTANLLRAWLQRLQNENERLREMLELEKDSE